MIRLRRLSATIIVAALGCRAGPGSAQMSNACGVPESDTSTWRELVSYVNGVEMRHPSSYTQKNWVDASSPELLKTVNLWRDDTPANNVRFANAAESNPMFQAAEVGPVRTCSIPAEGGVWRVRIHTTFSADKGVDRRPQYVVSARMPVPGDTTLLHFMGIARDSVERITQINMLRSFRLMRRTAKE